MEEKTYGFDDIVDFIQKLYQDIDTKLAAHIEKGAAEHGEVSCRHCTEPACCRQKVSVSVAEMLPIARYLKNNDFDTPELRERLRALGERMEGSPTAAWLDEYVPCVFLKNKRCTIYPVRPVRCRTYWVVSPPKLCQPPSQQTVKFIDDTAALDVALKQSLDVHLAIGLKENKMRILRGVLPRVLLIALEAWDSDDYRNTIRRQTWPSVEKINNGWWDGNNPFGNSHPPTKDPPPAV